MSKQIHQIECENCGGSGKVEYLDQSTVIKYGDHVIGGDWSKIENVWIWFNAFNGRGIKGYIYETVAGEYFAPFSGELIRLVKDTKTEFREFVKPTEEEK